MALTIASSLEEDLIALIYCRISKDIERTGLGVQRQEKAAREIADRLRVPVHEVYVDNDRTAARKKGGHLAERPEYERMLQDVARLGPRALVIGWDIDRLWREPYEQELFFMHCERTGCTHVTTTADDIDINNGGGIMIARIKAAVAAEEITKLKKRIRAKKAQLADQGLPAGGGLRRFGFKADQVTHEPAEAELLRDAAARVIAGEGLRTIVRDWNERKVPTVTGKPWHTISLRSMLMNPRLAGIRSHNGKEIGPAVWLPIIDELTHRRLVAILSDPIRVTNAGHNARKHLLTGFLVCGACGAKMASAVRNNGAPAYLCKRGGSYRGCGKVSILTSKVDKQIRAFAAIEATLPGARGATEVAISDEDAAEIASRIKATDAETERIRVGYREGIYGVTDTKRLLAELDARRRSLMKVLSTRPTDRLVRDLPQTPAELLAMWEEKSLAWRREVVDFALNGRVVEIAPSTQRGRWVDEERVRIVSPTITSEELG